MLIDYKRGQTSIILRIKIFDSTVSTGAGKTGLTSTSAGLVISTIADNEATATAYTATATNIETIATIGTYAAPSAGKCRFREVDATNHKGVYELQFADARFAVASARSLLVSISGATNAAQCDAVVPLRGLDPYDAAAHIAPFADAVLDELVTEHNISSSLSSYIRIQNDALAKFSNMVELTGGAYWRFLARVFDLFPPDLVAARVSEHFGRNAFTVAASGSTTTEVRTNRTEADDYWNKHAIVVQVSTGKFVTNKVVDYSQTNGAFTLEDALPAVPAAGLAGAVLGRVG